MCARAKGKSDIYVIMIHLHHCPAVKPCRLGESKRNCAPLTCVSKQASKAAKADFITILQHLVVIQVRLPSPPCSHDALVVLPLLLWAVPFLPPQQRARCCVRLRTNLFVGFVLKFRDMKLDLSFKL